MNLLSALALWLHDMATVILIGHYLLLVLVYLPLLRSDFSAADAGRFLQNVTRRIQPWMGVSLLVFMVTGVLLMLVNPNYLGVGQFVNRWSIMMVVKHVVVIGMIAVAAWVTLLTRPASMAKAAAYNPHPPLLYRIDAVLQIQAALGVLVLLLTGLARMG